MKKKSNIDLFVHSHMYFIYTNDKRGVQVGVLRPIKNPRWLPLLVFLEQSEIQDG